MSTDFYSLKFENDSLIFIDQTKLPDEENYISTSDYNRIAEAIEKLEIRGAPLIGIAALYGLALAVKNSKSDFEKAFDRLRLTRPTAVNLFTALNKAREFFYSSVDNQNYQSLLNFAREFHKKDFEYCNLIAKNGFDFISNSFNRKVRILTHCNTGSLATGGIGTAFGVILELSRNNLVEIVYACEARPLLQGLRLTSFELKKHNINYKIITDSTAAYLMQKQLIDFVIVGADRIAANGDTANKIGTYSLAVNAKFHSIPFYVAAPSTSIDAQISSGEEIIVEERNPDELLTFVNKKIINTEINALNFAFDITPKDLITAIITEEKVFSSPFNFSK
ncbi:MAG: S-methyl-5-thioribose-1-phosphate isomerase [Ignavibacteria bacterium]|jgi:methylthioribose-1-phosphate isomerase|nr:S-methyl-5-thioribose-1-phosphate isomerase [Ignavibacteria bacterium]MDH7527455.1 S-methyl-5-thioribose-1-phosphate isomerase [Ignavibacteria bacterium]